MGLRMFLQGGKASLCLVSLGLARGEKKWKSLCLRLVVRDAQSELVVNFGSNDH